MVDALDQLNEIGAERAVLWVLEDNDRARRFYERGGWAPTARPGSRQINGEPVAAAAVYPGACVGEAGTRDQLLRGNLWSRAPTNRPARTGGAPGRRRGTGGGLPVPVPVRGRVVGAGRRSAGGARRHHRWTTPTGLLSLGLPGDGQAFGRRRWSGPMQLSVEVAPVGVGPAAAGRRIGARPRSRSPRGRPACRAWPGCCSGRAAGPGFPPRPAGGGVRPLGQPAGRTRPAPSTPDAVAVLARLGVALQHLLGVLPEQPVHDVGRYGFGRR